MSSAAVFPEPVSMNMAAAQAPAAPAEGVLAGAGLKTREPGFAKMLDQGLKDKITGENSGADSATVENQIEPSLPFPQWMLDNPEMADALKALLSAGALGTENTKVVSTGTQTELTGGAVLAGVQTGLAGIVVSTEAQIGLPTGAPVAPWIPGFVLPGGNDGGGGQAQKKVEIVPTTEVIAEGEKTDQAAPVGKYKIDFSVFDAGFPEGWQDLLKDMPAQQAPTNAANAGEPVLPTRPGAGALPIGAAHAATVAPAATAVDENWLPLNLTPGTMVRPTETAGSNLGGQPSGTRHDPAEPQAAPRQEKTSEPMNPHTELRTEPGTERWVFTSTNTIRTTANAPMNNPAQVLSRLTDLQQKMVVDSFVQSAMPAFHGRQDSLTVELNPPELGRVQVRVENQGSQVNAVVTVQDRGVGEMFQNQADNLRKNLEEAGIRVGNLSVEIRQQLKQEAQEKRTAGQEKPAFDGGITKIEAIRRKAFAWGKRGLSQVDMMV
jgi:hypothetical protein